MEFVLAMYVRLSHVHARASSTKTSKLFGIAIHVLTTTKNLNHSVLARNVALEATGTTRPLSSLMLNRYQVFR